MIVPLILLALAPVAVIIWYFYIKDKYNKEPPEILALSFGLGLLSTIPAYFTSKYLAMIGFDGTESIFAAFFYAFIVIAMAEELAKFLFLWGFIYPRKAFDEPFDGIIYSVFVGMGFAGLENVIYVVQGGWEIAILRTFTAVPAHAAFGVIMGYYVGMAKFDPPNKSKLLVKGLLIAILLHGIYDFFIIQEQYEALTLISILVLGISIFYAKRAMELHLNRSPFKPQTSSQVNTIPNVEDDINEATTDDAPYDPFKGDSFWEED